MLAWLSGGLCVVVGWDEKFSQHEQLVVGEFLLVVVPAVEVSPLERRQCLLHCQLITQTHLYTHMHTRTRMHARTRTHTHNLVRVRDYPGEPVPQPIWILLKQETVSGSGISWAICKSALRPRQITTPAPNHCFLQDQMPFLPPNQQRQSTEGSYLLTLLTIRT